MIRFFNGRVFTACDGPAVSEGEVWTDGDSIAYVGPARADMPAFERQIDLSGDVLMPGFKDAHTHSGMTFLRSYADDLPLQDWLFKKVFPLEEHLTPERIYDFTRLAILEYLSGGITASFDMYFHRDEYARANIDSGFRTVICGVGGTAEFMDAEYEKYNSLHPLVSYQLGFHAEYTVDERQLRDAADVARSRRAPVWAHNSETAAEVAGCRERWGRTPTELFESLGIFDYGGGGFHCVHMSESDMEIFRRRGLWAVANPCSNAKLASGVAPLDEFMARGINIAVGTDGPASNNALDMFRELYLACVLQKLQKNDAAAGDPYNMLMAAVSGGARALGLRDCDCLAAGKKADMAVIDMSRPNMQPEHDILKNLVYAGTRDNIRLTMVAGKILYERGEFFVGADPREITARANASTKALRAEL